MRVVRRWWPGESTGVLIPGDQVGQDQRAAMAAWSNPRNSPQLISAAAPEFVTMNLTSAARYTVVMGIMMMPSRAHAA